MQIVQVVENLDLGGLERVAVDLAISHREAGHNSSILCLGAAGALASEAERAGIPVSGLNIQRRGFPVAAWRLSRELRDRKADVVHSHNSSAHLYAAAAGLVARIPAIVNTRHGVTNSEGQVYVERYFRATMPFTDRVVFVSDHSRRILEERGLPAAKSRVIINGIRTEKFAHMAKPGSAWPLLRFGTVGRMVPVKGHSVLLRAFVKVRERLPQAELSIVGGGPLMQELSKEAEQLGLNGSVYLHGPRRDIPALLAEWDIFVFSSTSEGLPVAVLEAMAAGLPVVSTRVGGVPEIAPEGEVAFFCDPGDAASLARAMETAGQCAYLAEAGAKAAIRVRERYSLSTMQGQYEALFREILDRRGRRV